MAGGDVIDFDRLRASAGDRREEADRLLALRDRRRTLESQVDKLERELRRQVVAHEELRRAEREVDRHVDQCRRELDELRERLQQRTARARELAAEFEQIKGEILELHQARTTAELELRRLAEAIRREAEGQRLLWHECRDSTADLTQLRRVLGGVLDEVRHSLSLRGTGDD